MKLVGKYISPYLGFVILGFIVKFTAAMTELFIPYLLEIIIDKIIPEGKVWKIFMFGAFMLLCAVTTFIGNVTANRLSAKSAGNAARNIRRDLFSKITYLSSKKCDEFTESSLVSRLTSDTYNVNIFMASMQRLGVRAPILLMGGIILTMTLDVYLSLILVCMLPLVGLAVFFVTRSGVPMYTRVQEKVDTLVRTVQENISGIRVIKALSRTEYERERFKCVNEELSAAERKASDIMALSNPLTTLLLNIGLTFVVIAGAYRIDAGLAKPGTVIAFLSYFTIMLNAMLGITRIFRLYTKGVASARRISQVLDSGGDMPVREAVGELLPESSEYHIEFCKVNFSYNGRQNNLSDISFALKRGQTLGIIGSTGSGKSTIINLLMRFYDVNSGSVRISGRDVRTIPEERLHTMFGAVFQNDFLFSDTIRANIDFGRGLSDEDIIRAAKAAQSYEFISALPEGLSHMLTVKGSNLSGGQKQRLLISRALAGSPEILILDDSSSALDYKTDANLRKSLAENYGNITSVIIAQRISSVRYADVILVLDDGEVIGKGTHNELMASCESYRKIAELQMGAQREEVQAV